MDMAVLFWEVADDLLMWLQSLLCGFCCSYCLVLLSWWSKIKSERLLACMTSSSTKAVLNRDRAAVTDDGSLTRWISFSFTRVSFTYPSASRDKFSLYSPGYPASRSSLTSEKFSILWAALLISLILLSFSLSSIYCFMSDNMIIPSLRLSTNY